MSSIITIMAIESSCDETSVAIYRQNEIVAHEIATQSEHASYGGVIPELASRKHDLVLPSLVKFCLEEAQLKMDQLDAIAYTKGPGLMGALLVGASFAKSMALSLDIPLIGVHHMEAHVLAHFLVDKGLELPMLCLTVSGGHTQLVWVEDPNHLKIIGETKDDAAGEAIDKAAKLLGLPYPGGPYLDKLASTGNKRQYTFPKTIVPDFDFSFSGIKTALLYLTQKHPDIVISNKEDLCASYLEAICDMLMEKFEKAIKYYQPKTIGIAGGVSANSRLRVRTLELSANTKIPLQLLPMSLCTDNAAMIAQAAYFKYISGRFDALDSTSSARLTFGID